MLLLLDTRGAPIAVCAVTQNTPRPPAAQQSSCNLYDRGHADPLTSRPLIVPCGCNFTLGQQNTRTRTAAAERRERRRNFRVAVLSKGLRRGLPPGTAGTPVATTRAVNASVFWLLHHRSRAAFPLPTAAALLYVPATTLNWTHVFLVAAKTFCAAFAVRDSLGNTSRGHANQRCSPRVVDAAATNALWRQHPPPLVRISSCVRRPLCLS